MNHSRAELPAAAAALPRILCVDDEPAVLSALERLLFEDFEICGETQPERALERLAAEGPFDVIVSDMRMPKMDGAALLAAARSRCPDTMRILLTGQADLEAAVAAVNDGGVFRFLCKPCPPAKLSRALADAVRQRQLVRAERELLEKTLSGAVRTLVEVLSLTSPQLFRRSHANARLARLIAGRLGLERRWRFEIAASLMHIGCVALPPQVLEKIGANAALTSAEAMTFAEHPKTAHRLLANIPRLEEVAAMVLYQREPPPASVGADVALGARVLRILADLDAQVAAGSSFESARALLRKAAAPPEAAVLDALAETEGARGAQVKRVKTAELRAGMILDEALLSTSGTLLVAKGTEVTLLLLERLWRFQAGVGIREPLVVRTPS